jgi:hypothetical protein
MTRTTRAPGSDVSTSMAGHSRVKSSTIVNVRNFLPLEKQSCRISIDHSSLGREATGKGAVRIRDRIFFRFRRTFRSSSV